ncbi:transmembrane anchor protein [Ottowia sp. VDI28]|uniref:transmembrane anchor protein n=1 Tax=Ottowia sp. VDI28 TaxID=3133968 RepID=UPI003C3023EA
MLLITVILPSEYGIDPSGVGRVLRLTEMGEIKTQLAAEAAADASVDAQSNGASASPSPTQAPAVAANRGAPAVALPAPVPTQATWKDEERFTLPPGQGIEIKLVMKQGAKAEYAWVVNGGVVNYDTHGDGGGKSISYEKGRGVQKDEGVLTADFTGNHGWFWRNRSPANVEVVLRTRGDYSQLKRVQ